MNRTGSAAFAGQDFLPLAVEKQVRVIGAWSSNVRCLRFALELCCEGTCLARAPGLPAAVASQGARNIEEREPYYPRVTPVQNLNLRI